MVVSGFQHPFGNGVYTPEFDGDGFYVSQHFDVPNRYFGGYHHRAEDWAQEGPINLNLPLVSPAHGTVLEVGGNTSHGNYIVISHQLPYSIVYDGYETSSITTVHLHLARPANFADGTIVRAGDTLTAGQQFGIMGVSGQSGGLHHDHFEIRLDGDLGLQDGYESGPADLPWVDPTDFILAHRYMGAVTGTDAADAISANVGSDSVTGGFGADTLSGAGGDDLLYGNQGADLLYGGDGADTTFGGQDADTLDAGAGDDLLYGNLGADSLSGGDGADRLYGGQGDDRLVGGAGDDTLFGNLGADVMVGGLDADTFHVSGTDTITDFDGAGGDRVAAGAALTGLTDLDDGTFAAFADGSGVVLLGIAASTVSTDWFLLA